MSYVLCNPDAITSKRQDSDNPQVRVHLQTDSESSKSCPCGFCCKTSASCNQCVSQTIRSTAPMEPPLSPGAGDRAVVQAALPVVRSYQAKIAPCTDVEPLRRSQYQSAQYRMLCNWHYRPNTVTPLYQSNLPYDAPEACWDGVFPIDITIADQCLWS